MRNILNIKSLLALIIFFTGAINLSAKHVVKSSGKIKIEQTGFSPITVTDDEYSFMTLNSNWENTFTQSNVKNIVEIFLDYSDPSLFVNYFSYSAEVKIEYKKWNSSTLFWEDLVHIEPLSGLIDIGNGKDKAVIVLPDGGNEFKVSLNSNSHTGIGGEFAPNLYIESRIELDRYYNFDIHPFNDANFSLFDETVDKGTVNVAWAPKKYAEWYDLEWTFINNYKDLGGLKLDAASIPLQENFFKLNSTRVSIKNNAYDIPMLYESGYLIFRVRAVGITPDKKFIQGKWSVSETASTLQNIINVYPSQVFLFNGHNDHMPWQTSVVYAEEGKNKASASYFDGTLRSQQAVVKNNSDKEVIVGETKYDHQGRPAINILPAPSGNEKVDFHPDFNLSEKDLKPYNRNHFDLDDSNTLDIDGCTTSTDGLSTSSGASKYYSPNNSDQTGQNLYIPDAKKFPFTQVQYENDNTGRIKRQSGVGPNHQLGSDHEVKYFYDVPTQRELYRLFGYEVGNSEKYRKQTVIDANEQATVSYLDPQGRVVATGFKGQSARNVDELTNVTPANEPINLISTGHNNVPTTNEKEGYMNLDVQKTFTETDIDRTFKYDLTVPTYTKIDECEDGTTRETCYDCVLDLEVSIKDDCENDYANGFKQTIGDDSDCQDAQFSSEDAWKMKSGEYQQGSYGITKKLKVNEEKLREYWESYLNQSENCLKNLDDFKDEQKTLLAPSNCEMDCDMCLASVSQRWPTLPGEDDEVNYALYIQDLKSCEGLCEIISHCTVALNTMIMDMAPNGQYGKTASGGPTEENGGLVEINEEGVVDAPFDPDADFEELNMTNIAFNEHIKKFPLSIFNIENDLPKSNSNWTRPDGWLYNLDGTISYVVVEFDKDINKYLPELIVDATVFEDPDNGILRTVPQNLKYVQDFIKAWKFTWAVSYVEYHPEYPLYEECLKIEESYLYDQELRNINHITANEKGYLDNGGAGIASGSTPAILQNDPFFNSRPFYKGVMNMVLQTQPSSDPEYNIGIAEMAHGMIECPTGFGATNLCFDVGCPVGGTVDSEEKWMAYIGLYNTSKTLFIQKYYNVKSKQGGYYNSCIGNRYYNFSDLIGTWIQNPSTADFDEDFIWGDGSNSISNAIFHKNAPCGILNANKYTNKTPRFPLEMPPVFSGNDADFCIQEDDVTNFDPNAAEAELAKYVPLEISCGTSMLAQAEASKKTAQLNVYKDCGLCPLASDLQSLLGGMFKFGGDEVVKGMSLSCGRYDMPILSDLIKIGIGFDGTSEINYLPASTGVNTSNDSYYINSSISDGSKSCSVDLSFSNTFVDAKEPIENFDVARIFDLCCFSHLNELTMLSGAGNERSFSFTAYYATEDDEIHQIYGEGRTECLDIASCSFDPVCKTTQLGIDLQNLLTILSFDFNINTEGAALTRTQNLNKTPYKGVVSSGLKNQVMNSDEWIWHGSESADLLTGRVSSTITGTEDFFYLGLDKSEVQALVFNEIVAFSGLRDDPSSTFANDYLVNAKTKNASGEEAIYVLKMQITEKSIPLVECTQTIEVVYNSDDE